MNDDPLAAARGIITGTLVGVTLWAIIAWVVVVWIALK
jgi:hypothetical protein